MKQDNDKLYSFYYEKHPIQYPNNSRGYSALLVRKSKKRVRVGYDYDTKDYGVVSVIAVLKVRNGKASLLVLDAEDEVQRVSPSSVKNEVGQSSATVVKSSEKRVHQYLEQSEDTEPIYSPQTPRQRTVVTRTSTSAINSKQTPNTNSMQLVISRIEALEKEARETKESIQKLSKLLEAQSANLAKNSNSAPQYPMFVPYPQLKGYFEPAQQSPNNENRKRTHRSRSRSRSPSPKSSRHKRQPRQLKYYSDSRSSSSRSRSASNSPERSFEKHYKRRRSRSPDRRHRLTHQSPRSPTRYDSYAHKSYKKQRFY